MEEVLLVACGADRGTAAVTLWISTPPSTVKAHLPNGFEVEYKENDLFECLKRVRLDLESQGFLLACQGARRNVFPSGMSRQMSDGRYAYSLSPGRKASDDDLVDIFAPAECSEVVSLADHQAAIKEFFPGRQ